MVNLTPREQNVMAALSSVMARFVYTSEREDQVNAEGLVDTLTEWFLRFNLKSQELDQLYDKFHRTGHNL